MFIELLILFTMIPLAIQGHIRKQFSPAHYILLEIIVRLLQSVRCVRLEVLAESIPLPILFESRRKKLQRFLSLPKLTIETLWFPSVLHWIKQTFQTSKTLYLAIDRTSWGPINLLIISLVWQRRGILLWCEPLNKSGSSSYAEQVDTLGKVLPALSDYKVVVLGDREFCSVKLGQWLGKDGAYFCLRLKRNTEVQGPDTLPQQLQDLGLVPGQKLFLNNLQVTQNKGFGGFNLAAKWKKRYRGFAPDEAWFILTNLSDLETAIKSYQRRFSIEEMFRDFKQGGYCLEACNATGDRLVAIVILIAIAYTSAALEGQQFKRQGLQRYISRPESIASSQQRHSAFRVGLSAYRWALIGDVVLTRLAEILMKLSPNKLPEYQRGMRAMKLVLTGL
jgi:hypothetical protein